MPEDERVRKQPATQRTFEVHVVPNVGAAFADIVQEEFASRTRHDDFVIALGGGSTAKLCYEALAQIDINWHIVTLIWGDERMVPLDHQDSNYLIAKTALIDKIGAGKFKAIHPMRMDNGAAAYEEIVRNLLPIDILHLGMGEDGHVLSLFPDSPSLTAPSNRLAVETGDDLHPHPRMTLTYNAVEHTRVAVFTIVGAKKLDMFRRVEAGEDFPSTHIHAARVLWIADPPAVGRD